MKKSQKAAATAKVEWVKNFIGHAKEIEASPGALEVVVHMDTAEAHIFEKEGRRYLKFTITERKAPDNYGRTHTAYLKTKSLQ